MAGLKRTPVKKRRSGPPRRGRIIDRAFVAWMHENNRCLVAERAPLVVAIPGYECRGRLTFHHVRDHGSQRNDRRGLMLCEGHHQIQAGKYSIEQLGKRKFEALFGVSIEDEIARYNELYERSRVAR